MTSILAGYSIILCMWAVFIANLVLPYDLNNWGIVPRTINGIPGIFCWSYLHGDFAHILGNSIALLILIPPIFAMHDEDTGFRTVVGLGVAAGAVNWLIGSPSVHVGASGMVYALAAYGFYGGIKQRNVVVIIWTTLIMVYMGGGLLV